MGLPKTVGSYVEGDRFWNRDQELKLLIEKLDAGANLLLIAQRRIGKTSLMHEAARRIQDRYLCLHVDLQDCVSVTDAIATLAAETRQHQSLWNRTKSVFANILQTVTDRVDSLQIAGIKAVLRGGLTDGDWQNRGDSLFAILADSDKPVVLFMDEVPVFVNRLLKGSDYQITPERREQVDRFMSWLRANSIKYQGQVRMVITGSNPIEPILKEAGLSATINWGRGHQ
ncbi:MAG: ATP-binding protein [Acaryochloris sp. RU_4_1]|nr:ATP-binding protein [Acaryochloris sp. RU_4_1]